jgi:hypothetical protein
MNISYVAERRSIIYEHVLSQIKSVIFHVSFGSVFKIESFKNFFLISSRDTYVGYDYFEI